jgi:adenosylcobinamide-GDP ribazoletransferase
VTLFKDFLLALSFLTRCPVPQSVFGSGNVIFSRSFAFFPLVGILIGLLTTGFLRLCSIFFPSSISGLTTVGFLLWLTRSLHLDGFADWIDGLGGGYTPERRREIMKDSRVGVFGASSIVIIVGLKALCFGTLQQYRAWEAVIIATTLGRFSMALLAARAVSSEQNRGLGARFIEGFSNRIFAIASVWLVPLLLWNPVFFSAALAITLAEVMILRRNYLTCFETISGDLFGATCEVVETSLLLAAVAFFGHV